MAKIIVNNLTGIIMASDPRSSTNFQRIIRKRLYNVKSNKSRSKLRVRALFLLKHYEGSHAFITLTTQQHKTGLTDSDLMHEVGVLLRNKNYFGKEYICVCERQRNTQDLHFHILTYWKEKDFVKFDDLRAEIAYRFKAENHPALLQFDWVDKGNNGKVAAYLSKLSSYVSKESGVGTEGGEYCSMFYCRTYSVSKALSSEWKRVADFYTAVVNTNFLIDMRKSLTIQYVSDFFCIYKNSPYLWNKAQQYRVDASRPAYCEIEAKIKNQ